MSGGAAPSTARPIAPATWWSGSSGAASSSGGSPRATRSAPRTTGRCGSSPPSCSGSDHDEQRRRDQEWAFAMLKSILLNLSVAIEVQTAAAHDPDAEDAELLAIANRLERAIEAALGDQPPHLGWVSTQIQELGVV